MPGTVDSSAHSDGGAQMVPASGVPEPESFARISGPSPSLSPSPSPSPSAGLQITRQSAGLGRRQLCAMLRKNWIVKRRAWCQTLCEILAPIFLTLMILIGYNLSANSAVTTLPQIYANQSLDISEILLNDAVLSSLLNTGTAIPSAAATGGSTSDPLSIRTLITNITDHTGPLPVPSFDAFVAVHNYLHSYLTANNASTLRAVNRLAIADARFNVLVNLGKLSFAPDTPDVRRIVAQLGRSHASFNGTLDKIYETEQDAVDYSLRDFTLDPGFNQLDPYVLRTWAVVVFDTLNLAQGQFDFTIRMNYSVIPTTKQTFIKFERGYDDTYQRYFLSGYLTLQLSIEQALVDVIAATSFGSSGGGFASNLPANISAVRSNFGSLMTIPLPVQASYSNPFFDSSGPFVGLVLCLSLLYPVSRLIKLLVEDKESRMKETLKIMGLFNWAFVASYGITYLIVFTLIAILQTILMSGSVLSHSSVAVVFIYFWVFSLSMLALAFLISVFFSRAKLAGIVGPIICFAAVMPRYAFLSTNDDEALGAKFFTCILAPTAFAFAMDDFMLYEGAREGITAANINQEPISVGAMLAFMLVDGLAYALLAWYFEQVLPNSYGTSRPPWFLFTSAYWRETLSRPVKAPADGGADYQRMQAEMSGADAAASAAAAELLEAPPHIEPIRSAELASKARVVISHLRKVFHHGNAIWNFVMRRTEEQRASTAVVAVKDLSLTMYEGQITCLLGHNGAGKTTTISMMSGLYKSDGGNCWIHGLNINEDMHQIRQHTGICPQLNVQFPDLTVKEHLELIAVLKGTPASQIAEAVTAKIAEVGLQAKTDQFSASLSGGQKRRLQLAMALIGDSKIVFLDEPTSGMDPFSRRSTWELLKRAKPGRVIVLTTHFMDEADLLGDRIAIIAAGQLRAAGSSLFLKNRYGIGYNLTIVYQRAELPPAAGQQASPQPPSQALMQPLLDADASPEGVMIVSPSPASATTPWTMVEVRSFVRSFVPTATLLSAAAGELSFQLPLSAVSSFGPLFTALDERKQRMGIAAYGVAMTTLDEVFQKVADEEHERNHGHDAHAPPEEGVLVVQPKARRRRKKIQAPNNPEAAIAPQETAPVDPSEVADIADEPLRVPNDQGSEVAASALFADHTVASAPPAVASEVANTADDDEYESYSDSEDAEGSPVVKSSIVPSAGDRSNRAIAPLSVQIRELLRKRILCASRDLLGRFFEIILPVIIVAIVLLILTISFSPAGPSLVMGPNLYQQSKPWQQPSVREIVASPLAKVTPIQAFAHRAVVPPSSVQYYPSTAVHNANSSSLLPLGTDWGLSSVALKSDTDQGLLYTLGMSNIPTTSLPIQQPFWIQYYLGANNSIELSLDMLADIVAHPGRRAAAYVFEDSVRVVAPLTDEATARLVAALIASTGFGTAAFNSSTIVTLPVAFTDASGTVRALNISTLQDILSGANGNVTTILLPTLALPVNAVISGTRVIFTLPGSSTPVFNIDLNDLARNATSRINGTDTFIVNAGGTNFTVDAAGIAGDQLTAVQLLAALQTSFPNTTFPSTVDVPLGTLLEILNSTSTSVARGILQTALDQAGLGLITSPVSLLHNVSLFHTIPSFAADLFRAKLTLMYDSRLQALQPTDPIEEFEAAAPEGTGSVSYIMRNHPLPLTTQSVLQIRAILAIFAALFVLIPFCYLPASFVLFLVKERSSKAKHLQLVSGVSPFAYWVSTYAFDMLNYCVVCVAVIIVFLGYNNESFTGDSDTTAGTWLLFMLYGFAVVPLAYAISFMFNNHTSAQVGIASLLFILGFVLTIGSFILDNIEMTAATNSKLKPFYRLSPPFCLGEGMINLATRALTGLISGTKQSVWDWDILGRIFVYLPIEAGVYFAITLFIEYSVPKRLYRLAVKKLQAPAHPITKIEQSVEMQLAPPFAASVNTAHEEDATVPASANLDSAAALAPQPLFASAHRPSINGAEGEPSVSRSSQRRSGQGIQLGVEEEEKQGAQTSGVDLDVPGGLSSQVGGSLANSDSHGSSNNGGEGESLEDDDVQYERRRVESGMADGDLIVVRHLRKTFGWDGKIKLPGITRTIQLPFFDKPMVAVQDLCLAVPAGQCFGFLGINGAGKSTTMSCLTGELEPDSGIATINGFDVGTELEKVRQELGYCPQFDPLLDNLTAREHLVMYGRVRGVTEDRLGPLVQHLIDKLGLGPFADNCAETYSGGNKRKLSLALALIGDPSVVFLDEPSTGMDPVSRRFMWGVIADLSKSMSIVLTTHSMEECEALCSVVAIMVNGALSCIGPLEHLKQKYSKGFFVELHCVDERRVDEVRRFVDELFEAAEELECHSGRLKYLIPRLPQTQASPSVTGLGSPSSPSGPMTLGRIFAAIESRKGDLGIVDYGVGGASLEQIFVQICQKANTHEADERAKLNDAREAKLRGD